MVWLGYDLPISKTQRLDSQPSRKDWCYATPQNARVSCDCLWSRESFWIIQQFRNMPQDQAEKVADIWERMSPDKRQDMMERLHEHQDLVNSLVYMYFPPGSGSRPCVWRWILRYRMKPLGNFTARTRAVVIVTWEIDHAYTHCTSLRYLYSLILPTQVLIS